MFKRLPLVAANITADVIKNDQGIQVVLKTDAPAFFVHPEFSGKGRFSDASFTLLPHHPVTIDYIGNATAEELQADLHIYHLAGSYLS